MPDGRQYDVRGKNAAVWEWYRLEFGQTILAKRRPNPRPIPKENLPEPPLPPTRARVLDPLQERRPRQQESKDLFSATNQRLPVMNHRPGRQQAGTGTKSPNLDELTRQIISSGFDPQVVGQQLLDFANDPDGIEQAIGFAAILIKAKRARRNKNK